MLFFIMALLIGTFCSISCMEPQIPSIQDRLFRLLQTDALDALRTFLEENPHVDVNTEDARGWRPIHYASLRGDPAIFNLLRNRQADLNAVINDGSHRNIYDIASNQDIFNHPRDFSILPEALSMLFSHVTRPYYVLGMEHAQISELTNMLFRSIRENNIADAQEALAGLCPFDVKLANLTQEGLNPFDAAKNAGNYQELQELTDLLEIYESTNMDAQEALAGLYPFDVKLANLINQEGLNPFDAAKNAGLTTKSFLTMNRILTSWRFLNCCLLLQNLFIPIPPMY